MKDNKILCPMMYLMADQGIKNAVKNGSPIMHGRLTYNFREVSSDVLWRRECVANNTTKLNRPRLVAMAMSLDLIKFDQGFNL